MNKAVIAFILGGITGALASGFYFKKVYEDICEEEIASIKKKYCIKKEKPAKAEKKDKKETDELKPVPTVMGETDEDELDEGKEKRFSSLNQYREILRRKGYGNYTKPGEPVDDDEDLPEPYTISPEEFGEKYGTDNNITLTYYRDGVLEDESGELIDHINEKIGSENLETFGEYEDDTVYVRNDILGMDYEIQRVDEFYFRPDEDD